MKIEEINNQLKSKKTSKNIAQIDEYEVDSSDEEDLRNTIGNIPVEWYNEYPHIGYNLDAKKIIKPKQSGEVDDFIKKIDDPLYWRTVKDPLTGQDVILSDNDVDLIKRVKKSQFPDLDYDPYTPFIDFFTYEKMIHPVTNRPETKASFIPSISEKRQISKLVTSIKRRYLYHNKPVVKPKQFDFKYDLWEKEEEKLSKRMERYIPAPKMKLPGHEESYNPPPEYLFDEEEEKKWNEQEPEERKINFIPQKYSCLRKVPAYSKFVQERYERCLDLYLCPRARKLRANVNPEDLIPKLPKPSDLQPFPSIQSIIYKGHEDVINCIAFEPLGQFFISCSNDCTVRIWEVLTGRCIRTIQFSDKVTSVAWCPDKTKCLCAVVVGNDLFLINPNVGDKLVINETDMLFKSSLSDGEGQSTSSNSTDISIVDWQIIDQENGMNSQWKDGIRVAIKHKFEIKQVTWHRGGDYFAVVMPKGETKSVVIHQLSKRRSMVPFKRSKGIIQCVLFHPSLPYFFVATKKNVRIYNLVKQELTKKLLANCNEISSMAIHNGGDNIIIGSYDLRLSWFDLDLSNKPYKTLRYHKKAIRSVAFHERYPLFASASDDGTVIVSHGMVYSDLMENPLIVPVKILKGHKTTDCLGVTYCCFHPFQPWILSSGADATIRLFV